MPLTTFEILTSKFRRSVPSTDMSQEAEDWEPCEKNWWAMEDHVAIKSKKGETVLLYPDCLVHGTRRFDLQRFQLFWIQTQQVNSIFYIPPEDINEFKQQNYGRIILKHGPLGLRKYKIGGLQQAVFPLMSYIHWYQDRHR